MGPLNEVLLQHSNKHGNRINTKYSTQVLGSICTLRMTIVSAILVDSSGMLSNLNGSSLSFNHSMLISVHSTLPKHPELLTWCINTSLGSSTNGYLCYFFCSCRIFFLMISTFPTTEQAIWTSKFPIHLYWPRAWK